MSLSDRIKTAEKRLAKQPGCTVCRWFGSLTPAEQSDFDAWISAGWSTCGLWELCAEEGLQVGLSAFQTHLRKCR